jgi:hypothetical protein
VRLAAYPIGGLGLVPLRNMDGHDCSARSARPDRYSWAQPAASHLDDAPCRQIKELAVTAGCVTRHLRQAGRFASW